VVASSILFNRGITLATLLGIGTDPIGSFGIILTLFQPFFRQETDAGLMIVQTTSKTEAGGTG
jgi:hypothetical protein